MVQVFSGVLGVLGFRAPSTAAVSPQLADKMQPESAADMMLLAEQSPSTAAVSLQPVDFLHPELAAERRVLASALQPERTVMP